MRSLGEDIDEYNGVFGYSIGETETRIPIYDYPKYSFDTTEEFTNIQI